MVDLKTHWESVYSDPSKIKHTWTQAVPSVTLSLLKRIDIDKSLPIIDIGGGDSTLVDELIELGYTDITVLDISKEAISRSQKRLGTKADLVTWVASNVLAFQPNKEYAVWIDRATFHFLQTPEEIGTYSSLVKKSLIKNGFLIIATFSEIGPAQCSGLPVKRYDKYALTDVFKSNFDRKWSVFEEHVTPSSTIQQFIYCSFQLRPEGQLPNHSLENDEFVLSDLSPNCSLDDCGSDENWKTNCC